MAITKKELLEILKDKPDDFPIYVSTEQWFPRRHLFDDEYTEEGFGSCNPQETQAWYRESHRLTLQGKVPENIYKT